MTGLGRRRFLLGTGALIALQGVHAQQAPGPGALVGYLDYGARDNFAVRPGPFLDGLREGGFVEGRNLRIEYRFAGYDYRKIDRFAEDLVRAKVQVIYAPGPWGVLAAKAASSSIPIVFSQVNDPVALGFVKSLARPAGNITGTTNASHELVRKRVDLMREMFPTAGRLGVLFDEDMATACRIEVEQIGRAGRQLGVEMREYPYVEKTELQRAFENARSERVEAVLIPTTTETRRFASDLVVGSVRSRVPTIHETADAVVTGGLMSYGPTVGWGEHRAGQYVARILKGAKPADLPVEAPTTYELAINLKTARLMDVRIPPSILLRADRVIE